MYMSYRTDIESFSISTNAMYNTSISTMIWTSWNKNKGSSRTPAGCTNQVVDFEGKTIITYLCTTRSENQRPLLPTQPACRINEQRKSTFKQMFSSNCRFVSGIRSTWRVIEGICQRVESSSADGHNSWQSITWDNGHGLFWGSSRKISWVKGY